MGWSVMRCGGDCSRDLSRLIGECDARDKTSSRSRRTCARRRTNHTRITHAKAQTTPTESNGDIWKGGKKKKKSLRALDRIRLPLFVFPLLLLLLPSLTIPLPLHSPFYHCPRCVVDVGVDLEPTPLLLLLLLYLSIRSY